MRILMLDNEFPPLGGGTGVVNYYLLEELRTYPDVMVDLVTSTRKKNSLEVEAFSERITIIKVPVDNRNIHHSSNIELLRYAWRGSLQAVRLQRVEPYDLSMAYAGVPAGFICLLLNVMFGLPYLVSLQGPDVPGFEARYRRLYPLLKPLIRLIWRRAGVVTAISRKHRDLALETSPDRRMVLIPNGIDLLSFSPNGGAADRMAKRITILCVGRLIERKGQGYLLAAFAQVLDRQPHRRGRIALMLVGTGDGEKQLRDRAVQLGIEDHVYFRGFLPREAMPAVYRECDIFVLPSFNEGMSMALLEAMASGLPVIVSDTGGTDELVCDQESGLIVPWGDLDRLAGSLERLLADPLLRRKMGRSALASAARFGWDAYAAEHVRLFRGMVRRS